MIEILQPLSQIPGVRYAGVVTVDGVPILLPGSGGALGGEDGRVGDTMDVNALAAFAYQWFDELGSLAEELTWDRPSRVVMKSARGTLVARTVRGGILIALLDRGVGAEQLRLPMEGAAVRIQRNLKSMGGHIEGPLPSAPAPGGESQPGSDQSTATENRNT